MEVGFIGFFTKLNLFIVINENHHWHCQMSFLYIFSLPVVQYFLLLWIINFHIETKHSLVMGSEVSVCDMELELRVAKCCLLSSLKLFNWAFSIFVPFHCYILQKDISLDAHWANLHTPKFSPPSLKHALKGSQIHQKFLAYVCTSDLSRFKCSVCFWKWGCGCKISARVQELCKRSIASQLHVTSSQTMRMVCNTQWIKILEMSILYTICQLLYPLQSAAYKSVLSTDAPSLSIGLSSIRYLRMVSAVELLALVPALPHLVTTCAASSVWHKEQIGEYKQQSIMNPQWIERYTNYSRC